MVIVAHLLLKSDWIGQLLPALGLVVAGGGAVAAGCVAWGYMQLCKAQSPWTDEVYDAGAYIIFVKNGERHRVPLGNIRRVTYRFWIPTRVEFWLDGKMGLGRNICFMPNISPLELPSFVEELSQRVEIARAGTSGTSIIAGNGTADLDNTEPDTPSNTSTGVQGGADDCGDY